MAQNNPQLPWTDEQWDRVQQVICEEARKARVAASFLPIVGPLPPDTDYVSLDKLDYQPLDPPKAALKRMVVNDTETKRLCTLEIRVYLRGPQVADPELTSALQMFRRAANVLARIEDALIFKGRSGNSLKGGLGSNQNVIWTIDPETGSDDGLCDAAGKQCIPLAPLAGSPAISGEQLVSAVSEAIGKLESAGHLGPFACVLDQSLFKVAQTPSPGSLVLPQDSILPFLGGGPLLRSSTLDKSIKPVSPQKDVTGLVVALGGAPVDLVLARDMTLSFLQVNLDPLFVFRVYEKLTLRIKEQTAIVGLES